MKSSFNYRVLYRDTDAEGVVYYANYLGFFERGRTELLREMGIDLKKLRDEEKIVFTITKVECDYLAPAMYDDEITVTTEIASKTKARVIFKQEVLRGETLLVSGKIEACAVSLENFKPQRLPRQI